MLVGASLKTTSSECDKNESSVQQSEIQKVQQGVLNLTGVYGNVNVEVILMQIGDFLPEMQPLMINTSHCGKEFMTNDKFYLDELARRFKIESLKTLPLSSDLKVFENFEFPDTLEGKTTAFGLVYSMNKSALSFSLLYEQLEQLVLDEAVKLVRNGQDAYQIFNSISDFSSNFKLELF